MAQLSDQAGRWAAYTASDTANIPGYTGIKGVFVGSAGNVVAVGQNDTAATFTNVAAGTFLPILPKRINATSTTAGSFVILYA